MEKIFETRTIMSRGLSEIMIMFTVFVMFLVNIIIISESPLDILVRVSNIFPMTHFFVVEFEGFGDQLWLKVIPIL
jgi:hypothetical protein